MKASRILKQVTDAVHLRLHQHPLLEQLHQTHLTLAGYQTVLDGFRTFYEAWEPRFSAIEPLFAHEAKPLDWLQQDYAALDMPWQNVFQQLTEDHDSGSVQAAIGYLYVKQGSTLGGQRISRHVQAELGLVPGVSLFFFHGFGTQTVSNWRAFLTLLDEMERRDQLDIDVASASALSAFNSLENILDEKAGRG